VALVLLLSYIFVNKMGLHRRWWVWLLSALALLWSIVFTIKNLPV
jgi:hypothetical protein